MQRFHQVVFLFSVVALSWFAMMATHELGHVVGAMVSGGQVERVVLHPLTISRTDVKPNPNPLLVVWAGPLLGCMLPLVIGLAVPKRFGVVRNTALFFAGFCLLANGVYIGFGAFDSVGDCGEMLAAFHHNPQRCQTHQTQCKPHWQASKIQQRTMPCYEQRQTV